MFIFYTIILTLGFMTSYTDIRFGKIRNIHMLLAIIFGLIAYTYLLATHQMTFNVNLLWNILTGLGIGLLLYFTDTWGAGDAKLFAVLCLLMPTEKYSHIVPFASLIVFINTFLLSTMVTFFLSINHITKTKVPIFKKIFARSALDHLGISFFIIISFSWIIPFLIKPLIPNMTLFLHVIIMYSFYHIIYAVMHRHIPNWSVGFIFFGLGLLARLYFQPSDFIRMSMLITLKRTIFYSFSFFCFRTILEKNKPGNENERYMPFAPFIFLGTLLANTNFLGSIMDILKILRK